MRAMVLAAGLGTRLRPLTDSCPKALVEIGDKTLLAITLVRLKSFGVREAIVNVHHFADMVVDYLKKNGDFGMRIEVSREDDLLLDTGGGLKKAGWFFLEQPDEAFLLHNVDVLSDIDLRRLHDQHRRGGALATLAVQRRKSSRQLLFDRESLLCGRQTGDDAAEMARACEYSLPLAFCGIHVISPRIFSLLSEEGAFPIIPSYLRLAAQGEKIAGFRADEYHWRDLGRPDDLKKASFEP